MGRKRLVDWVYMHEAKPSRTAQRVAMRRAAHQVLDQPKVFDDPLAVAIADGESERPPDANQPYSRALRAFLVVRSRYAEDQLARAVDRGVRQYVVLGAGLDTFAYRNPFQSAGLHVFEVDHPATQEWKRAQLGQAGIAIPDDMTFAAVDFERQSLEDGLSAAGFDKLRPAFFSWLGVTPYLSRAAFDATIGFIARMPSGSGVVFDYAVERSLLSPRQQVALDALAARVARAGEPFQLFFDPAALARDLAGLGFENIEDLNGDAINARYFAGRTDGLAVGGGGRLLSCEVARVSWSSVP
jgi:methyltransferase (TIGR00027 family)